MPAFFSEIAFKEYAAQIALRLPQEKPYSYSATENAFADFKGIKIPVITVNNIIRKFIYFFLKNILNHNSIANYDPKNLIKIINFNQLFKCM